MDFLAWSKAQPGLFRFFSNQQMRELKNPLRFTVTDLTTVLQHNRPICGIVALAMCSENPTDELVEEILERAKGEGYSCRGEMFSAKNMAQLARDFLPGRKVSLICGYLDSDEIKKYLLEGNLLLVPIDLDHFLNKPSTFSGTVAHWTVLCGAVETPNNFFVVARHGAHPNACLWELSRLADSNAQLHHLRGDKGMKISLSGTDGPFGLKLLSVGIDKLTSATTSSRGDETSNSCTTPLDNTADDSRRSFVDFGIYVVFVVTLSLIALACRFRRPAAHRYY